MSSLVRQYLFGAFFIAFGIYRYTAGDYLELGLYFTAGGAFISNALAKEPKLVDFKSIFVIITWLLIVTAAILLIYVWQFKFS